MRNFLLDWMWGVRERKKLRLVSSKVNTLQPVKPFVLFPRGGRCATAANRNLLGRV